MLKAHACAAVILELKVPMAMLIISTMINFAGGDPTLRTFAVSAKCIGKTGRGHLALPPSRPSRHRLICADGTHGATARNPYFGK